MIHPVVILFVFAGISAIPVPKDYYPKSGCGQFGCSQENHVIQQQRIIGGIGNDGFNAGFTGFDGRNAASAASSPAAIGFDASASASAASGSRGFVGHPGVIGLNNGFGFNGVNPGAATATAVTSEAERNAFLGNAGLQATAPYNGPIGHQVPSINYPSGPLVQPIPSGHYPTHQILGQSSGASAASSASSGLAPGATLGSGIGMGAVLGSQLTRNVGGPVFQPFPSVQFPANHVLGQNAAASASSAALGGSASAASAANIGSGIGMEGVFQPEFPSNIGGPVIHPVQGVYRPQFPVVGQTAASSAAAASAFPNSASAASSAAVGSRGFSNNGIIRGASGINNIVPGRKTY